MSLSTSWNQWARWGISSQSGGRGRKDEAQPHKRLPSPYCIIPANILLATQVTWISPSLSGLPTSHLNLDFLLSWFHCSSGPWLPLIHCAFLLQLFPLPRTLKPWRSIRLPCLIKFLSLLQMGRPAPVTSSKNSQPLPPPSLPPLSPLYIFITFITCDIMLLSPSPHWR